MALAVQANLVQLKVAHARRRGLDPKDHEITVSSPGSITAFRETLIDRRQLRGYSDIELQLRLREVWGQFCLMRWVFGGLAGQVDFAGCDADHELRCATELEAKHAEVHAMLWRLRFEQRKRTDQTYAKSQQYAEDNSLARRIPLQPMGKAVDACTNDELLLSACKHVGMLGALRWVMDCRRAWGDADLIAVSERPF